MQSSMTNPDRRPLPEGWISHFDPRRRLWYYINLNEAPPRTTYLHPDDEDPPSPPVPNNPLPPMNTIPPVPTVHHHPSIQGTTPFSNASQAYRARQPTFAQQLYASATTGKDAFPTPINSDEELESASAYLTNIPLPSSSPPAESNLFSTSSSYGYRTNPPLSSLPSPPLSPVWSDPSRRRPRGARSPTLPRPLPVAGPSFTLPPVNKTQAASDFRDRALFSSLPSDPTPPSTLQNPPNITRFRRDRSATLPSMKSSIAQPSPVGIRSKATETPMYSTVAHPLETSPNPTKTNTPAFQKLSTLPEVTNISASPPVVFSSSANVGLPAIGALPTPVSAPFMQSVSPTGRNLQIQSNLQPGNTSQPSTISPVVRDHQEAESDVKRNMLKKVSLAVGKSAGKMALRMGTKMALGSVGIPVDTSNMFSSDGDGVVNVITEGVSEMAASAAAAGVSQVLNAAANSSTSTNTSPPQLLATIPQQPTLSSASQSSIDPSSYVTILNQMQAMQLQNNSTQPVYSPAEYASILNQMQTMQMPPGVQRPSFPSSSLSYHVQPPSSQGTVSQVNGAQSSVPPQKGSAQGRWQQNLMKSVIGGATRALVSSAVDNIDLSSATDAVTSTFTSFDPTATTTAS